MTAKDIINLLSEQDIINLLINLGSKYPQKMNDSLIFSTICHCGNSHKLYYYISSKQFYCYTYCGAIGNIFNLVGKILGLDFASSYKYICQFYNISSEYKSQETNDRVDNSFIRKFNEQNKIYNLKTYDSKVLNHFDKLYHLSWLKDNITKETMNVFNIRYDILNNRIIIPHYNFNGELVGIRCRNLNENEVLKGRKYMPIFIEDRMYNYPTHAVLYGLHITKEAIKKYKRVYIVESEKAVMQLHSYYKDECIAVACSGSTISKYQIDLLLNLGVEECVLCLDKDFEEIGSKEDILNRNKITKAFISKLAPYFKLELIWDFNNRLNKNDSPTDKGKLVFEELLKERLFV